LRRRSSHDAEVFSRSIVWIVMTDRNSILEEAARWFAVIRRNVMTVEERRDFELWLEDPANRAAMARIQRGWDVAGALAPAESPGLAAAPRWSRRKLLGIAAASLALGYFAAEQGGLFDLWGWDGMAETGVGEQREITLPDNSMIHLNVTSRVKWRMDGRERHVRLEAGDALFTVSRDPERPFIVDADTGRVRVLGTVFSMSVRGRGGSVAVREGHVAFSPRAQAAAPRDLFGGQGLRVVNGAAQPVTAVAPEHVGEWSDHFVTFDGVPLKDVARELARYFPLELRLDPAAAGNRSVTLRLHLRDRDATLDLLAQLLAARIERKSGREVVLHLPS
jgi:transmembrane sensor